MRRIKQWANEDGCGIACVAMVSRRTYAEVRKRMFPNGEVTRTDASMLRDALERFGCTVAPRIRKMTMHYSKLPFDAILEVARHKDGSWHWVVWDSRRKRILDPSCPAARYRATRYLPVCQPK